MNKLIKNCALAITITVCAGLSAMAVNAATVSGQNLNKQTESTTANTAAQTVEAAQTPVVKSNVETVFNAKSVPGVATSMDSATFATLAGFAEGEKGKLYVGDVYKKEVKEVLKAAAEGLNGTVISMLDIDFYALSENGIRGANTFAEPVSITITLPKRVVGGELTVITMVNGEAVELADADNDPSTYTISTKQLGAFALIQK